MKSCRLSENTAPDDAVVVEFGGERLVFEREEQHRQHLNQDFQFCRRLGDRKHFHITKAIRPSSSRGKMMGRAIAAGAGCWPSFADKSIEWWLALDVFVGLLSLVLIEIAVESVNRD